jgi:hypothetical protein
MPPKNRCEQAEVQMMRGVADSGRPAKPRGSRKTEHETGLVPIY